MLGTELGIFSNPGPTFFPRDRNLNKSVIDLVFLPSSEALFSQVTRETWLKGPSDHCPLSVTLDIGVDPEPFLKSSIKPGTEAESDFLTYITNGVTRINPEQPTTPAEVDAMAKAVGDVFAEGWRLYSSAPKVTKHSKSWWNAECTEKL